MRPELFTIPGAWLAVIAPLMVAWGLLSLGLFAWLTRKGVFEPTEPAEALPRWIAWLAQRVDNPLNALLTAGAGVVLARYAAPVNSLAELLSHRAWRSGWHGVPLHAYGVMLGLSLVAGWNITLPLAVRLGIDRARAAECYVVTAASAVLGSRVLYVFTNFREFVPPGATFPSLAAMISLRTGGLVAYGGFLGGLLASALYARRHGFSLRRWADAAVPSLAVGLGLTRIGCFLYGCDFGCVLPRQTPAWFQRVGSFPRWLDGRGSPAWVQHTLDGVRMDAARCVEQFNGDWHDGVCRIAASAHHSAPVHPTQLYESLVGWSLAVILVWRSKNKRFDGQVLLTATLAYGLARSAIEILRDDGDRGAFAGLSTSQWIGLTTSVIAAVLYRRWSREAAAATVQAQAPQSSPPS
ncbi:MAG: prolipoprotein diacylglyceryl transferase [Deltaproteobacteria bacterium]|nr:prolipoprotein diacylglyceryl transferase [Deltaproteobacteria bacterium]